MISDYLYDKAEELATRGLLDKRQDAQMRKAIGAWERVDALESKGIVRAEMASRYTAEGEA